jgi:sec-independent protein translocase protein TatB
VPDINGWEFIVLAVLALVILGPDKLPKYAADAGRMIRSVRRMANDAKREVTDSLGPEFQDIDLADLNPRRFAKRHLLDPDDYDLGLDDLDDEPPHDRDRSRGAKPSAAARRNGSAPATAREPRPSHDDRAPYDPDAT